MPLILYECASPRFRHRPPNRILMIKVTFKFISALKQWLVCTIFFAIIPIHERTHSSKNYLLIFLHAFTLIFSITLFMSTLRMRSQSIQSSLRLLHFIQRLNLLFLSIFTLFLFFMQLQDFYHKDGGTRHTKGPPAENDRRPARRARGHRLPKIPRVGECPQLIPPFLGSPGRKQPESLPTVETS